MVIHRQGPEPLIDNGDLVSVSPIHIYVESSSEEDLEMVKVIEEDFMEDPEEFPLDEDEDGYLDGSNQSTITNECIETPSRILRVPNPTPNSSRCTPNSPRYTSNPLKHTYIPVYMIPYIEHLRSCNSYQSSPRVLDPLPEIRSTGNRKRKDEAGPSGAKLTKLDIPRPSKPSTLGITGLLQ